MSLRSWISFCSFSICWISWFLLASCMFARLAFSSRSFISFVSCLRESARMRERSSWLVLWMTASTAASIISRSAFSSRTFTLLTPLPARLARSLTWALSSIALRISSLLSAI